ncbi:helix-turn-helix domain-containing protein [Pseudomonas helleri]|uniref:helix-turn-helix domain-containing protein n=1 Tax=Pseudomonas helleri TaxID=1608996 RepID=UPI003FD5F1C2
MNTDQTTQETQHADPCQPKPISPIGSAAPCIRQLAQVNRLVGERVREARRLAGLSQVAMAERLGFTAGDLAALEKGQGSFDSWHLRRIATACKVTTVVVN